MLCDGDDVQAVIIEDGPVLSLTKAVRVAMRRGCAAPPGAPTTGVSFTRQDPFKTTRYHPPFTHTTTSWHVKVPLAPDAHGGSSASSSDAAPSSAAAKSRQDQDPSSSSSRYGEGCSKAKKRKLRKKDVQARLTSASQPGKTRGSAKSAKRAKKIHRKDPDRAGKLKNQLKQCRDKLAKRRQQQQGHR